MSLEQALQENTLALRDLIAAVTAMPTTKGQPSKENAKAVDAKSDSPKPDTKSESATTKPSGDQSAPTGESSSPALTYEGDVKPATVAVSKLGREKIIATLARFGVAKAQELAKDQWPEYLAYTKRVLNGEVDPEASHS